MAFYAMGDLHFSGTPPTKPMDIFHPQWKDHRDKILASWQENITDEDTVFLVGDISWAIKLDEAMEDLGALCALPGRKIMIRGNHDYWWTSKQKMAKATNHGIEFLQADSILLPDAIVAGTRGYLCPGDSMYRAEQDDVIYRREVLRMEMALEKMKDSPLPKIMLLHYPPFNDRLDRSDFTDLLDKYKVDLCIYGHLHTFDKPLPKKWNHTNLHLVSSNYLDFQFKKIEF